MTENNRIKSEKRWAGAVAVFATFSGVIIGSLLGGFIGRYRAIAAAEDCANRISRYPPCVDEVSLFLNTIAGGLITGAVLGMIVGSIFYLIYSRRLRFSAVSVQGLNQLQQPGKNGSAAEKA
jgi:hypothetical protein